MRIIGIDPSLTATGAAAIDITTTPNGAIDGIFCETIQSGPKGKAHRDRLHRFLLIGIDIDGFFEESFGGEKPDLAVIEGPSYASSGSGTWERAGLWWSIISYLEGSGLPIVEVPPSVRCKYATGRGNASKDEVTVAAVRRYPHAPIEDNNQADAVILAAIGARLTGHPIDDLPKTHLAALDKLPPLRTETAA